MDIRSINIAIHNKENYNLINIHRCHSTENVVVFLYIK